MEKYSQNIIQCINFTIRYIQCFASSWKMTVTNYYRELTMFVFYHPAREMSRELYCLADQTIHSRSSEQEIRCGLNANCSKSDGGESLGWHDLRPW